MHKIIKILPMGLLLPVIALAQDPDLSWFDSAATQVGDLVGVLIPIVIAIGLLFFIWGLVQFIAASGDEGAKEEGKRKMIWGVVALFVMVAVWGLVELLGTLVGTDFDAQVNSPNLPQ